MKKKERTAAERGSRSPPFSCSILRLNGVVLEIEEWRGEKL